LVGLNSWLGAPTLLGMSRVLILLLLGVVVSVPALSVSPGIHGETKIYSERTLGRAQREIRELYSNYKIEVVWQNDGDIRKKWVGKADSPKDYFYSLLDDRLNGLERYEVLVVNTTDPRFVAVGIGKELRKRGIFTKTDRTRIAEIIIKNYEKNFFDNGLLEALSFVRTIASNKFDGTSIPETQYSHSAPQTSSSHVDMAQIELILKQWAFFILAAILIINIVTLKLIRSRKI